MSDSNSSLGLPLDFFNFRILEYGRVNKSVQIFSVVAAILSTSKVAVVSYSLIRRPNGLHGFGLILHDLAQIHIIPGAMQEEVRLVFIFILIIFRGFCGLV